MGDAMGEEAERKQLKGDTKKATKESLRDEFNKYSSELLYWWGMDYEGWKFPATEANKRDKVIEALINIKKVAAPKNKEEMIRTYEKLVREKFHGDWRHTPDHEALDKTAEDGTDRDELDDEDEEEDEEDEEETNESPKKRARISKTGAAPSSSSSSSTSSARCRFCRFVTSHGLCPHCGCSSNYDYHHEVNVDLRRGHFSRLSMTGTEQKTVHTSAAASSSSESEKKDSALSGRDKEWKRQTDEGESFPRFTAAPSAYSVKKAFEDLRKSYYGANYVQPSDAMIKLIQSGKLRAIGHATPKSTKEELEGDGRDNSEAKLSIDAKGLKVSEKFRAPPVNSLTSFLKIVTGAIVPSLVMQPQVVLDWMALTRSVILLSEQYGWESANFYLSATLTNCVANRKSFGELDMDAYNSMLAVKMHGGSFQRTGVEGSAAAAAASSNRDGTCRHFNGPKGCNKGDSCLYEHSCSNYHCKDPVGHNYMNCSAKKDLKNGRRGGESSAAQQSAASFPPGNLKSSRRVTFNTPHGQDSGADKQ